MGKINGSSISGEKNIENINFVHKSKKEAKQYDWLYQCTSIEALLNILDSREIWLSNLQNVNDKEEGKRINVPKFEKSYFVSCFSYEDNISMQHWDEYGRGENSVLFGLKPEWVLKQAELMWSPGSKVYDKDFKVYPTFEKAIEVTINEKNMNNRVCNPYYLCDFGFYKVIYDDKLKMEMDNDCSWVFEDGILPNGRFIAMGLPGIIKNTHGICERLNSEPYDKEWTIEKEVRLKACIMSNHQLLPSDLMFSNMAVKLNDQAFNTLKIRFSPLMSIDNQKKNLEKITDLISSEYIEVLK